MNELKYTITKFDEAEKLVDVLFEDGQWAQIRLITPLPQNIEELEKIIKTFAAPLEFLEAKKDTESDLSYINNCIGQERTCTRFSIRETGLQDLQEASSTSAVNDIQLQSAIRSVLLEEGLIQ